MFKEARKPKYVLFPKKECPVFLAKDNMRLNSLNFETQKLYGAIFGFAVGDMLGVPLELSSREERRNDEVKELRAYGTYHQPFGTWSDDTSLMLCFIHVFTNGFSLHALAEEFINFYRSALYTPNDEVFDIGIAIKNAIEKMSLGIEPDECGGKTELDNGNGSLMRILPLAFLKSLLNKEEYLSLIEKVSSLTHAHKRAKLACIFYVELASQLILGNNKQKAYDNTIEFIYNYCDKEYKSEFDNFDMILSKKIIKIDKEQVKSTGYVLDTLEAVIWIFYHKESYKEMVLEAVNLGGDTDTIAAIVSQAENVNLSQYKKIENQWAKVISEGKEVKVNVDIIYEGDNLRPMEFNVEYTIDGKFYLKNIMN